MSISKNKAWNLTKRHIDDVIKNTPKAFELGLNPHLIKCLEWGFKLNPQPRYSLRISLYGHDIERAFDDRTKKKDYPNYDAYKEQHSINSANKLVDFLKKINADPQITEEVNTLVKYHDVGYVVDLPKPVYADLRILRDADAISLFDDKASFEYYIKMNGIGTAEEKLNFMKKKLSKNARGNPEIHTLYKKSIQIINEKKQKPTVDDFL